jgi:hypothetical protein
MYRPTHIALDLNALAIIADDKSGYLTPNGHNHRGFGSSVSTNLTHAKIAREKKPPTEPKPAPVGAPAIVPPTRSSVGRLIASYDEVIDAFRARADELELSRLEIDHLSGLAQGHSSHLLAKKYTQRLGAISLRLMLDTLGLRLLVVEDPDLTARTLKRRTPRKSSHLRVMRKLSAPST